MLEAGVASPEDIDKAMTLGYGHPMGPFELTDLVGLDVRLSISSFSTRHSVTRIVRRPLMQDYVNAGRFGRKTGHGVYATTPQAAACGGRRMTDLTDHVALVTGSSSGLGLAAAEALAARGARIALSSRGGEKLDAADATGAPASR